MMQAWSISNRRGFSLVEAILAVSIFALIITAVAGTYFYGEEANVLSGNRIRATLLAEEGLEVARNIRDADFSNLIDGTYGLATSSNQWIFQGSSDTNGIYNRQLTISTVDAKRKSVNSTVTWQQNPARSGSVSLVTYLTNWLASLSNGILFYGDGTIIPKYRTYDTTGDVFSDQLPTLSAAGGATFKLRASPTKAEAIAAYSTSAGVLYVMCFNGSAWSEEWTATVGGTSTTKRFDIAYETNSGDAIILYSGNVGTTNELRYRTKPGVTPCGSANWSGVTNLDPVRTSGIIQWVKMAWDRRVSSNLITAIWADANSDLSTMIWDGSSWTNEPAAATETSLEVITSAQDSEDFDVEYESLSGDVMVVWANSAGSNGTNGVRYRTCTGGTSGCTWGAVTTPPTFRDDATNLDISANPESDEIVFASIGNAGSDLQIGYWSGSAWTNSANVDTSCSTPVAGSRIISTGWLISGGTTRSIVTYADQGSPRIDWYVGNNGTFTVQTDVLLSPAPNSPVGYEEIEMNSLLKNELMLSIADNTNDLLAKRLVMSSTPTFTWSNSDGAFLTTTLPQKITSPFSFAFWRQ